MPFEKGHKKTGGRQKGTLNKNTIIKAEEILLNFNVNPIERLIELAESSITSVDQKINCYKEIARYTYPRLKAQDINIEHNHDLFESIKINVVSSNKKSNDL